MGEVPCASRSGFLDRVSTFRRPFFAQRKQRNRGIGVPPIDCGHPILSVDHPRVRPGLVCVASRGGHTGAETSRVLRNPVAAPLPANCALDCPFENFVATGRRGVTG